MKRIPFEKALRAPTTHRHDYLNAYVGDLGAIIDMGAIRDAKISLGVDPLGGASVHYWAPIAERYGLDLTVVNDAVDPTFRFMTVDWDGQIRMDPSSPYAMQRLIDLKDRFQLAFACDTDADRHGIVTRSAGLLPPNHYLAAAVYYLFQNRPKWPSGLAVGKTLVSSRMIDLVAQKLGRRLYEVPVGFKWFVDGLLDGSLGFGGEESAGASFVRLDGSVWTTDKDGIVPALLAAEITARTGHDPGDIYQDLTREFGEAGLRPRGGAGHSRAEGAARKDIGRPGADERTGRGADPDHPHPRAGQRRRHRRDQGDGRRWLVRGPPVRDRGHLQDLCGELSRSGPPAPHPGGGADDSERCAGDTISSRALTADAEMEKLQRESFSYFLHETNPVNGLVIDKTAADWPASIAATGLALAAYPVAVERGFMSRAAAVERTLTTLRFFWNSPQGPEPDATGYQGFYYHFLDMQTGRRAWQLRTVNGGQRFSVGGSVDDRSLF